MHWTKSHRADPLAAQIAESRASGASSGDPQFVPPGRCLVLRTESAYWVTSWPFADFVRHAWPGAWICSAFRNEGDVLSSELVREAVAATRWRWPDVPDLGMVTFVDASKVRHKRDPGRCFVKAGFSRLHERTSKDGLVVLQMLPDDMPLAAPPLGVTVSLWASQAP